MRVSTLLSFAALVACGDGGRAKETSASGSASLTGITASETGSEGIDPSNDTLGKLDVLNAGDAGASGPVDTSSDGGCKKVDLLFVIDTSGSMADEQINLVQSFPALIDGMRTELADTMGYNVGIITTDTYVFDLSCTPLQDGILVTQTGGADSSGMVCDPYASGKRYMTEADDLETKFACAAQVGTGGDGNERPMGALSAALSPALTDPGACNEGFLRDDALLVVVIITDEEDDHEGTAQACDMLPQPGSNGEPPGWFAAVTAAKGGKESSIVVLALVGPQDDPCPTLDKCNGGIAGAEIAPRIIEFTEMFTYGFVGSVCQPYGPFFVEAISVIKSACDDFEPPG
ncbi:MAG TPA: vWA domain-containing protein [Nannocystaceae bacterium]|nr:vWA domain-containing protein [Nannocystaceae bacterium]